MPATDHDLWELLSYLCVRSRLAVLERVASRPGQGAPGLFKFGTSFGELKMGLVASGVRYELVTPSVWQGKLKCRTKGDKNITKAKAQQLWPKLKITHAYADALLLAYYGWKFL
jgi:crossover junction endodeoxyribonuclease RuvC